MSASFLRDWGWYLGLGRQVYEQKLKLSFKFTMKNKLDIRKCKIYMKIWAFDKPTFRELLHGLHHK